MTEILTPVKIFWPQGLRCQSVERPDDLHRVKLGRQVRKILRERSRNRSAVRLSSPSKPELTAEAQIVRFGNRRPFYGGEDVKTQSSIDAGKKVIFRVGRWSVIFQPKP
jgi:hypothetical protein